MTWLMSLALCVLLLSPVTAFAARGFSTTSGSATTDAVTSAAIASTTARSFCLWFKANTYDATIAARLLDHSPGGTLTSDITVDQAGNLKFQSGWTTDGKWNVAEPSTGTWHHFCVTYDGALTTNNPIFYLDGATPAVTQTVVPAGTLDSVSQTYIIGNTTAGTRVLDGTIAEVAGWNSILSAGNAASLYNSGAGARADSIGVAPLFYFPLCGNASPETEAMGGTAATVTGTLKQAHPISNCPRGLMLLGAG